MQAETQTPDNFSDDFEISESIENKFFKKITNGQEMDVHAMLVPKGKQMSLHPYRKERVVVLSAGSAVVRYGSTKNTFKAPAHFLLPPRESVDIFTLEDVICYGIDSHESHFVPLDEEASTAEHFFTEGIYARKVLVPAGTQVPTHKHAYDHLSILAQGRVRVTVGLIIKEYAAPAMIEIKKNIAHTISAVENSVWFCVHATDATDIESLESAVIVKD